MYKDDQLRCRLFFVVDPWYTMYCKLPTYVKMDVKYPFFFRDFAIRELTVVP
jgi:hypothetical protein